MSAAVAPLGGWRPVFFSEIEPFPCALLAHRYPEVPNLGDMTQIRAEMIGDEKWRITNGAVDVELDGRLGCLAGGTPCQDVSVAGKRAGMAEGSGSRLGNAGILLPTGFWTLNTCEWTGCPGPSPSGGEGSGSSVCGLSDILETVGEHLRKYCLSLKACAGILRRAASRGKDLPTRLAAALKAQIARFQRTQTAET